MHRLHYHTVKHKIISLVKNQVPKLSILNNLNFLANLSQHLIDIQHLGLSLFKFD